MHRVIALLAGLLAVSLIAAPITMADWGEQASISVEPVDAPDEDIPVLAFDSLSPSAQSAVRAAIDDPNGHHVVYGQEDFPPEFAYSDYAEPGYGLYVVTTETQSYEVTTYAAGGFPFVYWFYELPFIGYGFLLGVVAYRTMTRRIDELKAAFATAPAFFVHVLGPELDFPVFSPDQFVAFGGVVLVAVALFVWRTE